MRRNRPAHIWMHDILEQLNTDIACVRLGKIHVIIVKSPELAREFLKNHDKTFASRPTDMASQSLSSGYLSTAVVPFGKQWKKMRRVLIVDMLNQSRMRWLLDKRNDEADNLVRFLYNQCSNNANGSVVSVRNAAQNYSASVIRKMIFNMRYFGKGRKDGGPGLEEDRHLSALLTILSYLYAFYVPDYLPWLGLFDIEGHEKKVRDAVKIIKQYQKPIIDERIRKWRSSNQEQTICEKPVQEDLLDVFILLKDANGQPLLSAEEIEAQVTELQLATVDNPSNATEWTLSEMLNHPEMLTKAQEELDRVVGQDMLVQESHIPHLPYITACVRESFRLHPVAPFNLPHVSKSDSIVAGYMIPKDSHVLLSRLGLGRNPKVWENPLRFDPERHLNEFGGQQVDLREQELRFISFSTGRRGCIGSTLGTTMSVMLLARLLQGFTWSMPPKMDKIDLTEARGCLFKLYPLYANAKPRLSTALYLQV
ncbi:tryptophan N-monooxygenase CYP79A68-like [Argentina anserina]|uniref:tryptophan N-monooxygenase CYP79A68-like n=1 Tax=Argentina anserina TaxID=57926 RepID=UPI0021764D81|nr:tryptophan N-monooxygenase CYP79A68-like [Potentilla anserina]